MKRGARSLAVVAALSVATIRPVAEASTPTQQQEADPYELYSTRLEQADDAMTREEFTVALRGYRDAYEVLPGTDRAGALGESLVATVVDLILQPDFEVRVDDEGRTAAASLLERYLEDVGRLNPDRDVQRPTEALALLRPTEDVEPEPPPVSVPVEPSIPILPPADEGSSSPSPLPPSSGAEASSGASNRRALGIGLATSGALVGVAGLALAIAGPSSRTWAITRTRAEFEDAGSPDSSSDDFDDTIEQFERQRWQMAVGGAVVAAVGAGVLGAGLALLLRVPSQPTAQAQVRPAVGSGFAGLTMQGRF